MVVIDLKKEALGASMKVRRRRLAVLRYLLRGYHYSEAWEELRTRPWWEGWSINTVRHDYEHLRRYIRDYGKDLPGMQEAIAQALTYYQQSIQEYDRLAKEMEQLDPPRYDLAQRYRSMRDQVATKAFNALGVSSMTVGISPHMAQGQAWQAVKVFFGIDISPQSDMPTEATTAPSQAKTKGAKSAKKKSSKKRKKGKSSK